MSAPQQGTPPSMWGDAGLKTLQHRIGEIVHVAAMVKGASADKLVRQPLQMLFMIDVSGSMSDPASEDGSRSKMAMVKHILHQAFKWLGSQDTVGIGCYAGSGTARIIASPVPLTQDVKDSHQSAIDRMQPMGNTNIGEALQVGCKELQTLNDGTGAPLYLMLLTDGQPNGGVSTAEEFKRFYKAAEASFAKNVRILCAGVGYSYDAQVMSALADVSHGHFSHIKNDASCAEAFGGLLGAASTVQHVDMMATITVHDPFSLEAATDEHGMVEENGAYRISLGDLFVESRREVCVMLELKRLLEKAPTQPIALCTVMISGTEMATMRPWSTSIPLTITITEDKDAQVGIHPRVYEVVSAVVGRDALKQATTMVANGEYHSATILVQTAIRDLKKYRDQLKINVGAALGLLEKTLKDYKTPGYFDDQCYEHERVAHTQWHGVTEDFGGQTRMAADITRRLQDD